MGLHELDKMRRQMFRLDCSLQQAALTLGKLQQESATLLEAIRTEFDQSQLKETSNEPT